MAGEIASRQEVQDGWCAEQSYHSRGLAKYRPFLRWIHLHLAGNHLLLCPNLSTSMLVLNNSSRFPEILSFSPLSRSDTRILRSSISMPDPQSSTVLPNKTNVTNKIQKQ